MTRKATTFRLDPKVGEGLSLLSDLLDKSLNELANEALRDYVHRRTGEVQVDLEATLQQLRDYRARDPRFEGAIAAFAEAEARQIHDPASGMAVMKIGSTQSKVQDLLDG